MNRKVRLTAEAVRDIDAILDYVEADSMRAAAGLSERLGSAIADLASSALRHQLVPDMEQHGIRRRVVGSYSVFYWLVGDDVEILHVVHGARDYASILFPNED